MSRYSRQSKSKSKYGSRRPQRGKKPFPVGKAALLASVIVVPAIGAVALVAEFINDEQMDELYCYARGDQPVHAVYLDASHTADMPARQERDYARIFDDVYAQAPPNTRIDLFTSGRDQAGTLARPVASMCKPAQTVADLDALGVRTQNQAYITNVDERARDAYGAMVERVLTDLRNTDKTALESALLSDLQSISRYSGFSGRNRSLTFISDGVENSENRQFCFRRGHLPSFSTFQKQARYSYIAPDNFDGARVHLVLVQTTTLPNSAMPYCTAGELRAFWSDYFTANGASNVTITRLRFGAGE